MEKRDYKKTDKALYCPPRTPVTVQVPSLPFFMVDGAGDPNDPDGDYQRAIALLYALAYAVKMSARNGAAPQGYFDYVVPPLESLWSLPDTGAGPSQKGLFQWTAMLRQPAFVTEEVFQWACGETARKKGLDASHARFCSWREGLCVQCMHIGPFDDEPKTLLEMDRYLIRQGLIQDVSATRRHHEIYLSDPRKTPPEKRRTVLRLPAALAKQPFLSN